MEDLFDDNESVSMDSLRSEDSNETKVKGLQSSKKKDSLHSSSVEMTIFDLFEADEDLYTDKNVLQCEVPQLTAWYKETSNGHILKDLCVDEAFPKMKFLRVLQPYQPKPIQKKRTNLPTYHMIVRLKMEALLSISNTLHRGNQESQMEGWKI